MVQNGLAKEQGEVSVFDQVTIEDFMALLRFNPSLQLPVNNIIQQRLLAEKDAEIERLTIKSND